tara:strand:- start:6522 stop:8150 length:1629 start_codon:yes stop_codon:yes gene_type:complete
MAKYTSDGNLIQGAATAYKNYDNAPGMYAGLDKVVTAGMDMSKQAMADKKVADAKALKDQEEADAKALKDQEEADKLAEDKLEAKKQERKDLENRFFEISAPIYESAGSFDDETGRYAEVAASLEALQEEYIKAMSSGTLTEKQAVIKKFNNIKSGVTSEVDWRATVTDPDIGLSVAAMSIGDGRDLKFINEFLSSKRKSDPEPNEKGESTYTIDIGGTLMTKTFAEIEAMSIMIDNKPFESIIAEKEKLGNSLKGAELNEDTRQGFEMRINKMLPNTVNKMLAFMNDPGYGGDNFLDLLNKPKTGTQVKSNKESIKEEIMGMDIFNPDGGGISPTEWNNFTDAIVNPYNDIWKKKDDTHDTKAWLKSSQRIVTEQMANGAENLHKNLNKPKEVITKGPTAAMLKLQIAEQEKQTATRTNINLAFNAEQQYDQGETTIKGSEDRLAQLVPEEIIKVDEDGNILKEKEWTVKPAYWSLTAKGAIFGIIDADEKDVRNEIIKHVTNSGTNPALGTTMLATKGPNKGKLMIYRGNGKYELAKKQQ